jgi:hypothetical protein
MTKERTLTRANLKTPRAAAIAGILFSILLFLVLWLLRISIPDNPQEPGSWLQSQSSNVALAVNLVPFAGIAFLWFIGVVRDRLGGAEDKFFATIFVGSGLLFLAMLFAAAAVTGGVIMSFEIAPAELINSATFHFARTVAYNMMNVYAMKASCVFMFTTSTIAIYTGFAPRWIAILGYALSLSLLFGSHFLSWSFVAFPIWVLVMSIFILFDAPRADQR